MASPKTPTSDSRMQEVPGLSSEELRSIEVPLGKSQLNSYARLPAFLGLAIVREAWATTLSRISNLTRSLTFSIQYIDENITVVQVKLDPGSPPITPPSSPVLLLRAKHRSQRFNPILSVLQEARTVFGSRADTVSSIQAEELVELFQQDLEVVLQSLTLALPPSPPAELAEIDETPDEDIVECNQPSGCRKIDRCIHDLVEEQVLMRPQQEAVCAHDGSLSYVKLSTLSSTLGHKLNQLGACPEQRVAILMHKSRWYSVAVLATLKSGATFVPLDPSHPDNRLQQLVDDIEPCVVLTMSSLVAKARPFGCPNVVSIDDTDLDTQPEKQQPTSVTPNNAAYMIFTSGSTGKPKGVIVEHSALATSAVMRGSVLGLGPESRVLQYAPHTFDVSVDEILTTWIHGGCVCVPSETDRFMIAEFMEATRVTAALLTPTSARTLNPDDVPTLRTLQTGGEVLTEDVNDKWSNRVTLFNVYGPTEASVACVISNRTGLQGTGHVLGRAVGGECWVVDPNNVSQRLAPVEIGELVIAGPILARGYFRDPVRTETSFVLLPTGERVYKTGDLASMDLDGVISYHGRKDLEIKIRGQRINIAEVEHAILQCDLVYSAVTEYPRSGPCANRLVAIICLNDSTDEFQDVLGLFTQATPLAEEDLTPLLEHVSGVLTAAMVPSKWITLPYLPQMSSTKVDRKKVRTWLEQMDDETYNGLFGNTAARNKESTPPQESDSHGLGSVWSKVLKLEPHNIRLDRSFIRNGGDSIMAMETRTLAHNGGIVIDIRDLLSGMTLHEIGLKATSSSQLTAAIFSEDTDDPFALSPVQHMYFEKIQDPSLGLQQRVSVEITQTIRSDHLRVALNYLIRQHRTLATRFVSKGGEWVQYIPSDLGTKGHLYGFYTTSSAPVDKFCTEPMSIEQGPLFHAHLHPSSGSTQILTLCAHHLVVDFVSWRVILHDLHDAIISAQGGAIPQPYTKPTLTFQQWCREQVKHASSLDPDAALPYQPGLVDMNFWQPEGHAPLTNTYAEVVKHNFRLSSVQTARLLEQFNNLPFSHPTDIMIGAFAMAFARIFPERETPNVFVEGHGREPWHQSLDISRTVGWFTAAYPIHLPRAALYELEEAIKGASERRQRTPANGHSYWACRYLSAQGKRAFADSRHQQMEVVFNYAGNVVQRAPGHGLFGDAVRTAEIGHPDCPRFSLFDIVANIEQPQQELVVEYSFPGRVEHRDRIRELVKTHQQLLVGAAQGSRNMGLVPWIRSCPPDIASLLQANGVDIEQDVEMVYGPSSIQQHMLHRQTLEPWYYRVQGTWIIDKVTKSASPVDTDRLIQAWRKVVHYHPTLRTVYKYSDDFQQFFAIVLRNVNPSVLRIQASNETTARVLCKDTEDLRPPHRMVLREMVGGTVECELEFSHVIIDAASRSIVLQDLADAYESKGPRRPLESTRYWEYLNLVQPSAENFGTFSKSTESMALVGAVAALPFELPPTGTSILEICTANEITISSFFMAAWAITLSQQLRSRLVSFDYVLSDRAVDLPGIEAAVGLFIRLPACQMTIKPGLPVVELARQVHAQRTRASDPGLYLPSKTTAMQGLSTLVNIRNSGTESLDLTVGDLRWSLRCFDDPWDYDLVFAVNVRGAQVLGCSIEYTEGVVSVAVASYLAESLDRVVGRMMQEMM
ncbi:hypothetical protein HK57_00018 [Aspergillus ustus]|uniref:Carrier domain-containing protein n=1 Tax=Aspergillus ustus TaxID=40382 RepID=A0A0C1BVB6_ASPUT|nr:hypothetical protein HK57_00018 [Aspergillus ustus]